MAKLTDKSALTSPANNDLLYIVDVSDTTDSAQGTSKKIEVQNLVGSTIPQSYLDTDGTLAANSDTKIATQKATKTYADTKIPSSYLDIDGTLSANSDTKVATQKATKTYSDTKIASSYLDTDGTLASNSDTKIATQKATKTYADTKLTNSMTTDRLLGRGTSGTGAVEEITLGTNLNLVGTTLNSAITFRNLLINGDMSVAQKSINVTGINSGNFIVYTADRWATYSVGPVVANTVETDAPTGTGIRRSFKINVTTAKSSLAANDVGITIQRLEGQTLQNMLKGTSGAKQIIATFWVKSNVTGTYIAEWYDLDNNRAISKTYTINSANTWEFKTIPIPGDTTGAFDNDANFSFQFGLSYYSGTTFAGGTLQTNWGAQTFTTNTRYTGQVNIATAVNNYFQFTGVQLEIADEASEFERVPFDVNLQRCFRYCYVLPNTGDVQNGPVGQLYGATSGFVWVKFPVKMRATPTASNIGTGCAIMKVAYTTGTVTGGIFSTDCAHWEMVSLVNSGTTPGGFVHTSTGTFSAEV